MRTSAVAGIVFANTNDQLLSRLTSVRSMSSVPFGGRYRLIDFALSNLVNAGVSKIGIITKQNYHSLMDHLGSGVYWDLDRKNGGIYLLPPYATNEAKRFTGTIDALMGAMNYIDRCGSDTIVLYHSDSVINVDISAVLQEHINNEADVTVIYTKGNKPENHKNTMILEFDKNGVAKEITFSDTQENDVNYGIGITVIGRDLLKELVTEAYEYEKKSLNKDVLAKKVDKLKICGYEHKGYSSLMDSMNSYYKANMDLLKREVRSDVFDKNRPVYTKTRDNMPTRYGIKSDVKNSFIADGCIINGTVKNSVLFRGVKVEEGAVIENCILMQETSVAGNTTLKNVVADKNAVIGEDMVMIGKEDSCLYIEKNQII